MSNRTEHLQLLFRNSKWAGKMGAGQASLTVGKPYGSIVPGKPIRATRHATDKLIDDAIAARTKPR